MPKVNEKSRDYWATRFMQLEEAKHNKSLIALKELQEIYDKAEAQIDNDINAWYNRVAKNNNISMHEAKLLLDKAELKEFKWKVKDYIKYGEENALNQAYMRELENASARVHISRLEALKIQARNTIEVMADSKAKKITGYLGELYTDNYYHSAFEIQKGFNLGWDLQTIDNKRLENVLSKPWAKDGKNFSDRIWTDKNKLINTVYSELSQSMIMGKNPNKVVKKISQIMGVDRNTVSRLVMTESSYISSVSQKDCFNDLDVERYEFVATLDSKTSEICREWDGEVILMKDYNPGVTAPPLHVYCRSVTAPYFDDNYSERIVGGGSNAEFIDSSITYKEWQDKYVLKK